MKLVTTLLLSTSLALAAACGGGEASVATTPEPPSAPVDTSTSAAAPAADPAVTPTTPPDAGAQKVAISVTDKGFEPGKITVRKDEAVDLVFTRMTDATCAKAVIVNLGGDQKVEKVLPLNEPVTIAARFTQAGDLNFGCAMGMMIKGTVTVQ